MCRHVFLYLPCYMSEHQKWAYLLVVAVLPLKRLCVYMLQAE